MAILKPLKIQKRRLCKSVCTTKICTVFTNFATVFVQQKYLQCTPILTNPRTSKKIVVFKSLCRIKWLTVPCCKVKLRRYIERFAFSLLCVCTFYICWIFPRYHPHTISILPTPPFPPSAPHGNLQ